MEHPHVVILPFPAQGHIKPMLMLAELLSRAGFAISFVNTEHSHRRLDAAAYPGIDFLAIPDGLPPEHPRSGPSIWDLLISTSTACKPVFKELIESMSRAPTCIICDGIMSFAVDVAAELGIPAIAFRTYGATATWTYFYLEKLIEEGEIPVVEGSDEDMDGKITCIPGLENTLRRRDLPSICRFDPHSPILQFFITQSSAMRRASALILNTFDALESTSLSRLRSLFPSVYALGPLRSPGLGRAGLLRADPSCLRWLDSLPPGSVLYVSFGSVAVLSRAELVELWHGLVDSGKRFLWAIRPGLIWDDNGSGSGSVPEEMMQNEWGRIVGWAPQEEVLGHEAVGGFLTHCGWNSILESVWAGKAMICWPMVAEQPVNGRCVSGEWGLGVDLSGGCDRATVARAVRELMEGRRSTAEMARLARESVGDGGSSKRDLEKLIDDIKILHSKASSNLAL